MSDKIIFYNLKKYDHNMWYSDTDHVSKPKLKKGDVLVSLTKKKAKVGYIGEKLVIYLNRRAYEAYFVEVGKKNYATIGYFLDQEVEIKDN